MRAVLMLLASLATSPAGAENAKVWVNAICGVVVESNGDMSFSVATVDDRYKNVCSVTDWPTSSPTATMECTDGSTAYMEVDADGVMELTGLPVTRDDSSTFYPRGDDRVNCH